MLRGHQTRTYREILGRYNRGPDKENNPPKYLVDERNLMFSDAGIYTRDGTILYLTTPVSGPVTKWNGTVLRMNEFKRIGEASRFLILDNAGNIYDSTNLDAPILTVANMVDFGMVVLFNRAYISPSDGKRGLTGAKIYVYDGTGAARPAGCTPPSSYTLVVSNGTGAGHIDTGLHFFSIVFETSSGAISKMGLGTGEYGSFTFDGNHSAKLTGIPTGPGQVTKRHVVATRVLTSINVDPSLQAWYFIPNATINDNTTTTLDNISFYDGNLTDSADYLLYNLSEIPAGAFLSEYQGRLVVGGAALADFEVKVSTVGQPESISDLDGTITVDPGDMGGGVKNAIEYRNSLYITKSQRTYVTQDNGSAPNTWTLTLVDGNIGAEPHSSAVFLDSKTKGTKDQFVVADRTSFFIFNGSYGAERELSYVIGDEWKRINPNYFHTVQVVVNPVDFKIFVAVPLDSATEPSHVFLCSYHEGLAWDKVKWSIWQLPKKVTSLVLRTDYATGIPQLFFGSSEVSIYRFTSSAKDDFGNAILSYGQFPLTNFSDSGGLSLFSAIRSRIIGSGECGIVLYGADNTQVSNPPVWSLISAPGYSKTRLINFVAQSLSTKVGVGFTPGSAVGDWFEMRSLILSGVEYWEELPA